MDNIKSSCCNEKFIVNAYTELICVKCKKQKCDHPYCNNTIDHIDADCGNHNHIHI